MILIKLPDLVDFLKKWQITLNQFFVAYVTYLDRLEAKTGRPIYDEEFKMMRSQSGDIVTMNRAIISLYKYIGLLNDLDKISENMSGRSKITKKDFEHMVDAGILDPKSDRAGIGDNLILTEEFIKDLFVLEGDFHKFWDEYPAFYTGPDKQFPLKLTDKEAFEKEFLRVIKTKDEFKTLMEGLEIAKKKKLLNMKINTFLSSMMWKDLVKGIIPKQTSENDELEYAPITG